MTITNVTPRGAVQVIIEISKKQWATQSATQTTTAIVATRPKQGRGNQGVDGRPLLRLAAHDVHDLADVGECLQTLHQFEHPVG